METKQLLKYIKNVRDLEVQYEVTNSSMNVIKQKMNSLGIHNNYNIPVYKEPEKPSMLIGLGFLIMLVLVGIPVLMNKITHFWLIVKWNKVIIPVAFIISLYYIIKFAVADSHARKEYHKKKQSLKNEYEYRLQNYQESTNSDEHRVSNELALIPQLQKNLEELNNQNKDIKKILDQYYSLNIIHGQYRSLICISTFYQYLSTGRCSTLKGHEGCYNLFEQEKLMGVIITKLDNISQQLNQIIENQYELAMALQEINKSTEYLCNCVNIQSNKIDVLEENQRVQNYCSEQNAKNIEFLKSYTVFKDIFRL